MLITGGNNGLGKHLSDYFGADSVSRSSGYDIIQHEGRQKIAERSLEHDVLINNAFDGPCHEHWADFGQAKLLEHVAEAWKQKGKTGHIINIGSIATEFPCRRPQPHELYRIPKIALDVFSEHYNMQFARGNVKFKVTNLKPGLLDTEKMRNKPFWNGHGTDLNYIARTIEYALNGPEDLAPGTITLILAQA